MVCRLKGFGLMIGIRLTAFLVHQQLILGKHTIFGRISSGLGVVNRIGLVQTDSKDRYCLVLIREFVLDLSIMGCFVCDGEYSLLGLCKRAFYLFLMCHLTSPPLAPPSRLVMVSIIVYYDQLDLWSR